MVRVIAKFTIVNNKACLTALLVSAVGVNLHINTEKNRSTMNTKQIPKTDVDFPIEESNNVETKDRDKKPI